MASATLALACLLLIPGAGPTEPKTAYMNERYMLIPVSLDPAKRDGMSQVRLYTLNKDGKQWDMVGTIMPDKDGFPFRAAEDGTYLFKVAVLGKDNQQDPVDIFTAPINIKIVIDTVPPEIRILSVEAKGEEWLVRWEIKEEHPDLASLTLDYRTENPGLWISVPLADPQLGQASFRTTTGAPPVAVRMKMRDLAKNECPWVEAPVGAGARPAGLAPGATTSTGPGMGHLPPLEAPVPNGKTNELPPPTPPPGMDTSWSATRRGSTQTVAAVETPGRTLPDFPAPVSPGKPGGGPGSAIPPSSPQEKIAAAGAGIPGTSGSTAPVTPRPTSDPLDPPKLTNKRQIVLKYMVENYGASGLGEVRLFITCNDGQTWEQVNVKDESVKVAHLPDATGNPPSLPRSLMVTVPQDGVYGFYLVVPSGAGLSKPDPKNGDRPILRVEVDTKAPEAELIRPQPDPNNPGILILRWRAQDPNLTKKPITLEWAERKAGPWNFIGEAEMANTGHYPWKVPTGTPHQVYLKLTVRDQAGNVSVAETDKPELVDLNKPEVKGLQLGDASPR